MTSQHYLQRAPVRSQTKLRGQEDGPEDDSYVRIMELSQIECCIILNLL